MTSSDEVPNDDLVDLRPVPASADSDVRDDIHLGFLVQPRAVAYRAVLDVDHAFDPEGSSELEPEPKPEESSASEEVPED